MNVSLNFGKVDCDKVAIYLQSILEERPLCWMEAQELIEKKFHLTKGQSSKILGIMYRADYYLMTPATTRKLKILYIPKNADKAREMYLTVVKRIPFQLRLIAKRKREENLAKVKELLAQGKSLTEIQKEARFDDSYLKELIGELYIRKHGRRSQNGFSG